MPVGTTSIISKPETTHVNAWRQQLKLGYQALEAEFLSHAQQHRLFKQHCQLIDGLLKEIWQQTVASDSCSLIAVGGYGRAELYPHSDIDLLILIPESAINDKQINQQLETLIGWLWDIGLSVGHSVRSLNECMIEAAKDITVQTNLMEYTRKGGTLIVQYNTNFEYKVEASELAPYKLSVSRDRVTDENAEVRFLKPEHKILNQPNKITAQDFSGWVQERGLYFPNDWDKTNFDAILSSNDPGEPARDGGLLVAKYGSGYYIYTGYSWFRQLPAGVPGAFRIFANMISIGK
jgi:hypothetical protein